TSVKLASGLDGLRKDTNAVAFRLGGLEEEAAGAEQMRAQLAERVGKVQEHGAGLAAAEQMRAQLAEWVGKVQAQVQEHGAGLAALRTALQQLVERIDAREQDAPIRPGQRIAMGDSGLIVQTADGARMLVRQQDPIGRIIADGREWEPHVREAIERAARPDGVAIDAGAYIG